MVKPKIGLSMLNCLGEPFKKMTECLPEAGTAYIEIVDDGLHELTEQRVTVLKELGNSYEKKYSVHAPFADINIASPSKPLLEAMLKRLEQSIASASALDAYVWIFHPGVKTGIGIFYPGMDWLQNLKTVKYLAEIAEGYGVKIAIENVPEPYPFLMKSVDDFARFYGEIDENVGLVLDVGHSNINGQTERFLEEFSDKIVHVHAHDNDGRSDRHLGVGYGNVDWNRFGILIKNSGFGGVVVVESVEHVEESMDRLRQVLSR
jgi:sugar phosphate isomerase/epimerase